MGSSALQGFLVIPLLDFVSIAVGREGGQESLTGISLLAVFPVIWLCASGYYPRVSLWLSFLCPLAIIWVPLFIHGDVSGPSLAKSLLVPVMMLGIGVSVSVLTLSMMRQQRSLEEKDEQLQAGLASTKRHEALLNSVLDTVHMGVLAVDADGHDILMNRKQRANHELARPKDIEIRTSRSCWSSPGTALPLSRLRIAPFGGLSWARRSRNIWSGSAPARNSGPSPPAARP